MDSHSHSHSSHSHGGKVELKDNHGLIFNMLLYTAIFTSVFFLSFIKPHRYYKNIISYIFNVSFTWRGAKWKIYHVMIFIIFIFALLLGCKYRFLTTYFIFSFENASRYLCESI